MADMWKPPTPLDGIGGSGDRPLVFLGGSIEMGRAADWRSDLSRRVWDLDVHLLNPRRDDWDPSWPQDPTPGTPFRRQVDWELDAQQASDVKVYFFVEGTASPITLMELGMFGMCTDTLVYCTEGFHRYGNVATFCDRYRVPLYGSMEELAEELRQTIERWFDWR